MRRHILLSQKGLYLAWDYIFMEYQLAQGPYTGLGQFLPTLAVIFEIKHAQLAANGRQYDRIGRFLKVLGNTFSNKRTSEAQW